MEKEHPIYRLDGRFHHSDEMACVRDHITERMLILQPLNISNEDVSGLTPP
jgi:hypothetical protein